MKSRVCALVSIALLVAACGGSATPAHPSGLVVGGTLTVGMDSDIVYADPSVMTDAASRYVAMQVVEGLVGLTPGTVGEVVPVLAAALPTVSADGLTYTFKVRTGIKFHDGTDFDAAAVKYNYERWNAFTGELAANAYYFKAVFGGFGAAGNIASVEAPDLTTVAFHLRHPQSNFVISQTSVAFGILSPAAIEANDGNNAKLANNPVVKGEGGAGKAMVGTGPFVFDEWTAGDHVTLMKNAGYWDSTNGPYLDKIEFKPFANSAAKLAALQDGKVNMIESADPTTLRAIYNNSSLRVLDRGQSCNLTQIGINDGDVVAGQANVLSNPNVRLAVSAAVNKQSYITGLYGDGANIADSWLPPGALYYKRQYLPSYDISRARAYLAAGGLVGANIGLTLYYPSGSDPSIPDAKGLAMAIASDLQRAGITVDVKEASAASYAENAAAGKYQMWIQSQSCGWGSADFFLNTAFFHFTNGTPSPQFSYANSDLATLMSDTLIATDAQTVATNWQKAQDLIAVDMPTVPLLNARLPAASAANVRGFVGAGGSNEVLSSVWLAK